MHLSGLYYKHMTTVNNASSIINNLEALLTDNSRVVIYDCHVFIVQATGVATACTNVKCRRYNIICDKLDRWSLVSIHNLV